MGFEVRAEAGPAVEVRRGRCAGIVEDLDAASPRLGRTGILVEGEIAALVDGGYMKFLETPSGRRRPALAADLKELQDFREDLREALGLPSLYNESLGTVCASHAYDRLSGRPM
jgi:hypothetical protein